MKTFALCMIVAAITVMAACKKENAEQPSNSSSATSDILSALSVACPEINPSNFVKKVDNPYLPWIPGTSYRYVTKTLEDGEIITQHQIVTVTHDTKKILGVDATVVYDVVKEDGIVVEETYDWYAQDKKGNVWYLGEDTKARTDTGWTTEGSWEAGVNGACAGIVMFADFGAHLGQAYRQEYLKGIAEDAAKNLDTNVTVKIHLGTFYNCVKTAEFSRLEPGVIEYKYYAPGIGNILVETAKGGHEREELVSFSHQ